MRYGGLINTWNSVPFIKDTKEWIELGAPRENSVVKFSSVSRKCSLFI